MSAAPAGGSGTPTPSGGCAYQDSVLVVKQAQARAPEGLLSAQGTVDLRGPIKLQLAATGVDVTTLAQRFRLDPLHGKAFLRGEVSGSWPTRASRKLAAYDLGWANTLEMLRASVAGSLQEVRIEECRGFMLPAQMGNVAVTVTDRAPGRRPGSPPPAPSSGLTSPSSASA